MMRKGFWFLLFFSLFLCDKNFAQFTGFPIRNYPPEEYNASPQIWSAIQDTNGLMYFGSSTFLLEYDGRIFRRIFVQKSTAIRSLGIDSKGRIYVASVGNFGYLAKDKFGGNEFVSLLSLVPEKHRTFSDIWKIHVINDTVIFQSNEKIFLYDQKTITPVEHRFPFASISFKVDDKFIVRVKNRGLHILKNGTLELLPNTEAFAEEPVFGIVNDKKDPSSYLILTATKGFFRYVRNCRNESQGCLTKISAPSDEAMINAGILGLGWLNDSIIAVHSRTGLYLLNSSLELKDIVNKNSGLADETMSAYFTDKNGQTWLTLNNGIAKVSLESPFYYYTERSGLNGVIESVIRDGNYMYCSSTSGVYYTVLNDTLFKDAFLNNNLEFKIVEDLRYEGWGFYKHAGKVYIGTSIGVFRLNKGKAEKQTDSYTSTVAGSYKSNRLYFGQKDGLAVYEVENDKPIRKFFYPFSEDILHVNEVVDPKSGKGDLWLSTRFSGLVRFNIDGDLDPSYQHYDSLNGLPAGNLIPAIRDNQLYFFNSTTAFIYNRSKDTGRREDKCFEIVPEFSNVGISDPGFWEMQFKNIFTRQQFEELSLFGKSISRIVTDNNGTSWLCAGDKLVRFDGRFVKDKHPSFTALIRSVHSKDSIIDLSAIRNMNLASDLGFKFNSLQFTFGSDWFDHEESTMFRWRLIGFDSTWSDWSRLSAKEYTNLDEGAYTLELQARNKYGDVGETAKFNFHISPPWYRSIPAYVCYLIAFIGIIILSVRLSVKQLQKAKDKLENLVTERTAEVVRQRDIVEQKNSLLELAYKDISDSISYASRIQQAFLPAETELRNSFKDHFILFQPRDVVSGDFYWHAKYDDQVFIAAADCTGHGVPGALMSMIGNTLLNEIIVSKRICDPGEILSQLDKGVKRALKQLTGEIESNDGMDIALCRYDVKDNGLTYAGANRPLFAFMNGTLIEIKADKKPVGGAFHQEGIYTSNSIKLEKDSMIYLFSDGYHDQFGGKDGKKFMMKRMKQLLSEIHHRRCDEQRHILHGSLNDWKGDLNQIDDILVVGIRF